MHDFIWLVNGDVNGGPTVAFFSVFKLTVDNGERPQKDSYDYDSAIWLDVVPFTIRGKLMDYAHHNIHQHHFGLDATFDFFTDRFYWETLYKDVDIFCKCCSPCQFTKGSQRLSWYHPEGSCS